MINADANPDSHERQLPKKTEGMNWSALRQLRLRHPGDQFAPTQISLQMCVAAAFVVLIILLGVALISYSYNRHREIALKTASELFDHITLQTASDVGQLYAPIETLVDLTSQLAPDNGIFPLRQAELLGFFSEALKNNRHLDAVYLGYSNGDFFLVRNVASSTAISTQLAAPKRTAFVAQRISRDAAEGSRHSTDYYDKDLLHLGTEDGFVTGFDPRRRDWYYQASQTDRAITTAFYLFYTSGEVGTTVARKLVGGDVVVGADLTLEDVSIGLQDLSVTDSTEIIVFSRDGTVLGYHDHDQLVNLTFKGTQRGTFRAPHISDFRSRVLEETFHQFLQGAQDSPISFDVNQTQWYGSIKPVAFGSHRNESVYMAIVVPEVELLKDLATVRWQSVLMSIIVLAVAFALAWWLSKNITKSAASLAKEAEEIRQFKLDTPITVNTRITEISRLAKSMGVMKTAISRYKKIATAMSTQQSVQDLIQTILDETRDVSNASYAALLLLSDDGQHLTLYHEQFVNGSDVTNIPKGERAEQRIALRDDDGNVFSAQPEVFSITNETTVIVDDVKTDTQFDAENSPYRTLLLVPLKSSNGMVIGVLKLAHKASNDLQAGQRFSPQSVDIVESLASNAAMAMENQRLIRSHSDMFESLIRITAVAIDAKSPHTGGHCQRVPVLTQLLAEAASTSNQSTLKDYELTDEARRVLHVASWLHDCGKVTTPEHVADKATKLETVHNRIHEIRTRFEVLWRDAEIDYYKAISGADSTDDDWAYQQLEARRAQLQNDFEFIAECNIGSESMTPERIERVRSIARSTWQPHFDDSIGLSEKEHARKLMARSHSSSLHEFVLADKNEHLIRRLNTNSNWSGQIDELGVDAPEYEYNLGEIHSLTVERGTLTPEERFKVNDHVTQTLLMLKSVPFPRELQHVPNIAGNHHERLNGTGFPRGLTAADLGIEDRIMAIADIFEALTAADRPYKKAKTLSESMQIMSGMRNKGHICPDLFDLFLKEKVYESYVEKYLEPWQIDAMEFAHHMRTPPTRHQNNVN